MSEKPRQHYTPEQAARRLSPIFHPNWCVADDLVLMKARAARENFAQIAERLERPRIAVEQRFHRLRVVRDVVGLLEDVGLTMKPYPFGGAS